ncbi:DNA recombination protein RmuC [Granulicella aggregans]|uniref:DNA recombination protein RmuC n=1 Tax=Granulicella aggregans TaxID=474949 RepID=UPI0021E0DCAF|nr:DNA recombination protein RmuC [Granulicella aggregans]
MTPFALAQLALLLLIFIAVVMLFLRKPELPAADTRLLQLPDQLTRVDARADALDRHFREELESLQRTLAIEAQRSREASAADAVALRNEVSASIALLGQTLNTGLNSFRGDNKESAEALRAAVEKNLEAISQRLSGFIADANRDQMEARTALNARLNELSAAAQTQQEKLRGTVEERLEKLNVTNAAKLEEMRVTVDEKLHATLQTRLTESFGQVTDQLNKVHTGLGEMSKLSEGMDDLSRIFTNVKSRGGFAEVQLGMLLEQMLAPSQFIRNAKVKQGSLEVVEFAVRFPGHGGDTLLPIDAKFPREDWERLENAYESGSAEEIQAAGKSFENAIRTEGKRICEKYIQPPVTTPHAIMFLPTEGLYAEVMRREGLQAEIQSKCKVTIAGPSSLSAILTSFQMGFALIAFQKKGDEVWKVLGATKGEFEKFGDLMGKMETQVGTVQNTIQKLNVRTRAINRTLREVTSDSSQSAGLPGMEEFGGIAPLLAASADEE